jgi:hypothetical protein
MRGRWLRIAPFILVVFAAFVALGGWIVQLLWNGLVPPLFGLKAVTFWQALGLLVLCRILFGGMGMGGGGARRRRRWETMTPEERERFRRGFWGRIGFAPAAGGTETEGAS